MEQLGIERLDAVTMAARASEAEAFLRSLASRHRLMILCTLLEGEIAVGELLQRLGLNQSNLSRHLATLREEGLVATRREGVVIHYRIASERVRPILAELYRLFCAPSETPSPEMMNDPQARGT
ncbi:metalloregulator ArsR/SmtB family transcription factor [Paeniroseomonas aquatica]|uniref:Metalloregulator ArsR/SmtB family transcription factor n=1 Tax=Paeniroseomonas aquatica TaxID=373043 RepID=A0ABT8A2V3_9PROT|nr:metalloregulator ArsR/SmtB family transcription factor [Paeniroseomonas aquatica]MDN3563894.1 metalloregulator ArsR/SmtB family transcription factor [Paeniroseomonas aquatica]